MHRFFVDPQQISGNRVQFTPDIDHQLRRVLRLQDGDEVLVLDNQGGIYEVKLVLSAEGQVYGEIQQRGRADTEPSHALTLFIGLTQREKFEWILQKGTEIGVTRFVPFISERSLVQKSAKAEKKGQRWQAILREAAEQSHRGRVPVLEDVLSYAEALKLAVDEHDICLIPWEEEQHLSLRESMAKAASIQSVALMIGPEGGFSAREVQAAVASGFISVTLGKRILRMETAAIAAAAMVLFALGDMD